MSSEQVNEGEPGRESCREVRRPWAGRAVLALFPLAVLAATSHQMLLLQAAERWREFSSYRSVRRP